MTFFSRLAWFIASFRSNKPRVRFQMLAGLAGLVASSCASGTKTEWMRLSGDIKDCENVVEVCLQSYPPKCMKACLDESPRPCEGGGPPGYVEGDSSGALKTGTQDTPPIPRPTVDRCGIDPCVFGISEAGTPTAVCYPPDCLIPQIGTDTGEELNVDCRN